ncbi:eIF-2alpha kinase GCN2 [Trachipleistophora hominis]|uniref:non-specific serine/threonine protein kinase n=1 Tax=Trachipleistophora hominis TaxID=72359 RepID=L7K0M2_TRAHO|nr:eIF-2alpha kinase GCN2 [Trachipleistophora hominis]
MTLKENYWRDFKFTQKLGQGTHASVYKMMNVHTGQHFALKEINLCYQEDVHNECLPRHITHKNIMKYTKLFVSERPEQLKDVIASDNDEQDCVLDMQKLRNRVRAMNEHSIFSDGVGSLKTQGCERRFYYMVCDYCEFTLDEFIAKRNELFFYGRDLKGMLDELSVDEVDDKTMEGNENDVLLFKRTKRDLSLRCAGKQSWCRHFTSESNGRFYRTSTSRQSVLNDHDDRTGHHSIVNNHNDRTGHHSIANGHNEIKTSNHSIERDRNDIKPGNHSILNNHDDIKPGHHSIVNDCNDRTDHQSSLNSKFFCSTQQFTKKPKKQQNVIYFDTGDLFTQNYKNRCNKFLKCTANVLICQNRYFYLYNSSIINYQNKRCINRHFIAMLFKDIVRGILYLHTNNIFHCDIKSNNILLKHETVLVPKISDFGLRRSVKCRKCHYKDVYDCGVLYFEMLCPVKTVMEMDVLRTRLKETGELPEWFVSAYGEETDIIRRCMSGRRAGAMDARHLFKRMIELCKRMCV